MIRLVALDTGPLGLLTHPRRSEDCDACYAWVEELLEARVRVVLPAIADYELRREYHQRNSMSALRNLDFFRRLVEPIPMSDETLRRAAVLWGETRRAGRPTSSPAALDGDCILVTQVRMVLERTDLSESEWIIATSDIGDLKRLAPAARWQDILPRTNT